MKILFLPLGIEENLMNSDLSKIDLLNFNDIKIELDKLDENYSLKEVNIGEGADWIMILAVLNGISSVFLLGDKIDKGLEGWVKIGKRVKNIFSRSSKMYIDRDAAIYIAISHLSEKHQLTSLKLVMQYEIPIKDLSNVLINRESHDFIAKPYTIYFMTFEINENIMFILSVRSDGTVNEHYDFDLTKQIPF